MGSGGIRPEYQGIDFQDLLFRFALSISLEWDRFLETPLWQISNRAFYQGEKNIQTKLDRINEYQLALQLSKSSQSNDVYQKLSDELLSRVLVEKPRKQEELEQIMATHHANIAREFQ